MQNILITGISSGIGRALADAYLEEGYQVYGIGRTLPPSLDKHPHFVFFPYDLKETFLLRATLKEFLQHKSFDLVILNAGVLGEIESLSQTHLSQMKDVMEVNLWANKELIDTLAENAQVTQIVGISSGASLHGSKGWGAYALSKCALNMLFRIYAQELPHIHFNTFAPGVIRTPMTEYILNDVDEALYPSVKKLKNGPIQTPQNAAKNLIVTFPKLLTYENGSFVDIRQM
jgi:NAD(P)-dependent dehydrogenase (short-subunit alcohol dehydrogenase family)